MTRLIFKLILVALMGGSLVCGASSEEKSYVYLWSPQKADVGPPASKDYDVLKAILYLCTTKKYSPTTAEGIDFIIRKNFLVSAKFTHAYRLYLNRINQLNPSGFANETVQKGQVIVLPVGPKYGASDLSDLALSPAVRNASFMAMSQTAYQIQQDVSNHIKHFSVETLKYYVSPSGKGSEEQLFQAIKDRGLVYALPKSGQKQKSSAQIDPIELTPTDEAGSKLLASVHRNSPDKMLPGMFPVSTPQTASCPQNCTSCRSAMDVPAGFDFSKTKVLVVDTGVQAGLVSPDHLIKQTDSDDGVDVSPQFHGTFVYSEIAAATAPAANSSGLFGVIPQDNVFVSRAVRTIGAAEYFTTADIINAWNTFSLTMDQNYPDSAYTRVVNVSAFGEPVADLLHPPAVPFGSRLLLVAAAGNNPVGGTEDAPAENAFARLSGGSAPLIIVGALNAQGSPATYSNWNSQYVQLFAPGDCVCGGPGKLNGTSQATPLVTVAAATVAASHPDWNPLWVMWRLLSTSDHPPALQGKALAGTVNLARALSTPIYLAENVDAGAAKVHEASAIVYDQTWKDAFHSNNYNVHNKETLRLYNPTVNPTSHAVCFTMLSFLYYPTGSLCVDANAKVQITENGAPVSLSAAQINDLILPMPDPNGNGSNLPNVSVTSAP
jgi:hypothetical protein